MLQNFRSSDMFDRLFVQEEEAQSALVYYRRVFVQSVLGHQHCIVAGALCIYQCHGLSALISASCVERDFSADEEGVTMYLQFLPGNKMAAEVELMRCLMETQGFSWPSWCSTLSCYTAGDMPMHRNFAANMCHSPCHIGGSRAITQ